MEDKLDRIIRKRQRMAGLTAVLASYEELPSEQRDLRYERHLKREINKTKHELRAMIGIDYYETENGNSAQTFYD